MVSGRVYVSNSPSNPFATILRESSFLCDLCALQLPPSLPVPSLVTTCIPPLSPSFLRASPPLAANPEAGARDVRPSCLRGPANDYTSGDACRALACCSALMAFCEMGTAALLAAASGTSARHCRVASASLSKPSCPAPCLSSTSKRHAQQARNQDTPSSTQHLATCVPKCRQISWRQAGRR